MKILLKSPYVCLVKTNNEEYEIDQNDTLEIEHEKTIFVYPQDGKQIPFYINLQNLEDCERYSVVKKDDTTFILLEKAQVFDVFVKEKMNFSGKIVEIGVGEQEIHFHSNGKDIYCTCENDCHDFSTLKIKDFACVQFKEDLYVFSVREEKVYHFNGEIEINGNQISVTKKFHDSFDREKKSIFRLEEEIVLEDEEFVKNAAASSEKLRSLAPYKLLESVKAKDFDCAMNYLSENLKQHIGKSQIQEFFGNFTSILPITTTQFITICGKKKNFVQFSLSGNVIEDISVDAL